MMFAVLILVACTLGTFLWVQRRGRSVSSTAPGPLGLPILGNLLSLGRKPHQVLTDYRYVYGDVYQITMGSYPTIVLNGIKTIRQAMVKQGDEFAGRPDFYSFRFIANGNSMGFSDYGNKWKMHRKIAQNVLALCTNKRYNPIEEAIAEEAKFLVQTLLQTEGKPTNPHNEIYLSVGNIICALCFGKRYHRDDADFLQLVKNNDDFMAFVGAGNPVDIMPWMRHFTKRSFRQFLDILDTMNSLCLKKQQEHVQTYDPCYVRDITDALIKASKETSNEEKESVGLTDEHIMTTLQELIGAGFDTIASTLQWSILFLIKYPDIQEKVHNELKGVFGVDEDPDLNVLSELPFTEATLMEIMRHSCIFPLALPHSTTKDTTLGGHFIKDKTLVFANLWSVSHDPEYFPEPELFDPYRFLNASGTEIDRAKANLFIPFGLGKRKCPGEQLAKMELLLFFSILVQRLKFECVPGDDPKVESKYGLTLKPLDFNVVVSPRQG